MLKNLPIIPSQNFLIIYYSLILATGSVKNNICMASIMVNNTYMYTINETDLTKVNISVSCMMVVDG